MTNDFSHEAEKKNTALRNDSREAKGAYPSNNKRNSGARPRIRIDQTQQVLGSSSYNKVRDDNYANRTRNNYNNNDRSGQGGYNRGAYTRDYNRHENAEYNNRTYDNRSYNGRDYHNNEANGRPTYQRSYNNEQTFRRAYDNNDEQRDNNAYPRRAYNNPGGQKSYRSDRPNTGRGYYNNEQQPYHNHGAGYNNERQEGGYTNNRNGYNNGRTTTRTPFRGKNSGNYDPNAKYSLKKRIAYSEANIDPNAPIRLNKFLSNAGVCSRRDADKYIQAGVVTVNGQVLTDLGTKVLRSDEVRFHDNPVSLEKKVYILLNKPKGFVTTSDDPQKRKTVMDLVGNACPERIYPIGRLDRNTTGVLLFTNDGEMAAKLTHPKFLKKKIYHVFCDKNISASDMRQIAEGITLEDGEIKADAIEYASLTDKKQAGIEIHSGKNRIVRRIFEHLGYRVTKLDRVYFAGLTKKNLKRGDWRFLTEDEVRILRTGAFE